MYTNGSKYLMFKPKTDEYSFPRNTVEKALQEKPDRTNSYGKDWRVINNYKDKMQEPAIKLIITK